MEQNRIEKLKSKYIGLHSSRFQSCFIDQIEKIAYHAKGGYVIKRDPVSMNEISAFKAHNTSIMVLLPIPILTPTHLISLSYSGDMSLFTLEGHKISEFIAENQHKGFQKFLRHGCTNNSGTLLATVSLYGY